MTECPKCGGPLISSTVGDTPLADAFWERCDGCRTLWKDGVEQPKCPVHGYEYSYDGKKCSEEMQ